MDNTLNQLTLGLGLNDAATFDNFFPARNVEIVTALKKMVREANEKIAYLCGSRGGGCSHLLNASCHYAHLLQRRSIYLPLGDLIHWPTDFLQGFESLDLICIDNLQIIAGNPAWEEALFHLFNRAYDAHVPLIISAHDVPKALPIQLADLSSRLSWGVIYQLHSLNDDEKLCLLIMRAERRGMTLTEEVGKYILSHCPRHLGTLIAALDALDKASLAAQRRLTIPFVKEVLQI